MYGEILFKLMQFLSPIYDHVHAVYINVALVAVAMLLQR